MKKKGLLALGLAATMAFTTACSGGGAESTTAAPAAEEKTESAQAESGEAASGEEITLKIANYAILEAGYDTFWGEVKEGFEAKYPKKAYKAIIDTQKTAR